VPVPVQECDRSCFGFVSFYDFSIAFWKCSHSVIRIVIHFI